MPARPRLAGVYSFVSRVVTYVVWALADGDGVAVAEHAGQVLSQRRPWTAPGRLAHVPGHHAQHGVRAQSQCVQTSGVRLVPDARPRQLLRCVQRLHTKVSDLDLVPHTSSLIHPSCSIVENCPDF